MIYLFVCNEGPYLLNETRWAITSISRYEPDARIQLVLFDSTGKYDRRVKRWHPSVEIIHFVPDEPIDYTKPGFFFSFKTLVFEHALKSTSEDILFLDGDIIVRGPLAPIFDEMGSADLAIRYRPSLDLVGPMGSSTSAKLNTGVVAIRNSERTQKMMTDTREIIAKHLESNGDTQRDGASITTIDQEAMWLAYEKQQDTLEFFPLNDVYNDSYFWPDSIIWHAKGKARQHRMYLASVDELKYGRLGRWRHRKNIARHAKIVKRALDARLKLRKEAFALSAEEATSAIEQVRGRELLSFSSDFLLANPDLQAAASSTRCLDWDPAAYHINKTVVAKSGAYHAYCMEPSDVDLSTAELVLTDIKVSGPSEKIVARILPNEQRFQDASTLFKLLRRANTSSTA